MGAKLPHVEHGVLYAGRATVQPIALDTPTWFTWLEAPGTTRFSYALIDPTQGYISGFMTVRKEGRQRGGAYWVVFRRDKGRLRKVYLGRSATVTHARLEEVAQLLWASPPGVPAAQAT